MMAEKNRPKPLVNDEAPTGPDITPYDQQHFVTYMRLLDAETQKADWKDVARILLQRNPENDPDGAKKCWELHLARARWMTKQGYRRLLEQGVAGTL